MFSENIQKIKDIYSFAIRNLTWLILGAISLYFLEFDLGVIKTIFHITLFEALALGLSGLALFAYTKIDFINGLFYGEDGEANSVEQHAILRLFGNIFIGVHVFVGLIVLGTYLANLV